MTIRNAIRSLAITRIMFCYCGGAIYRNGAGRLQCNKCGQLY